MSQHDEWLEKQTEIDAYFKRQAGVLLEKSALFQSTIHMAGVRDETIERIAGSISGFASALELQLPREQRRKNAAFVLEREGNLVKGSWEGCLGIFDVDGMFIKTGEFLGGLSEAAMQVLAKLFFAQLFTLQVDIPGFSAERVSEHTLKLQLIPRTTQAQLEFIRNKNAGTA